MSYSFSRPCNRCKTSETCSDQTAVVDAIQKIHETSFEDGHQGSGNIDLVCSNFEEVED